MQARQTLPTAPYVGLGRRLDCLTFNLHLTQGIFPISCCRDIIPLGPLGGLVEPNPAWETKDGAARAYLQYTQTSLLGPTSFQGSGSVAPLSSRAL
jgi:hypothetical protein